jgi:hypothetical protein
VRSAFVAFKDHPGWEPPQVVKDMERVSNPWAQPAKR